MTNGKGDAPRPLSVDNETYKTNWERTFNTPEKMQAKISASMEQLQKDIDVIKEKLALHDNCEYSGLPSASSYEDI